MWNSSNYRTSFPNGIFFFKWGVNSSPQVLISRHFYGPCSWLTALEILTTNFCIVLSIYISRIKFGRWDKNRIKNMLIKFWIREIYKIWFILTTTLFALSVMLPYLCSKGKLFWIQQVDRSEDRIRFTFISWNIYKYTDLKETFLVLERWKFKICSLRWSIYLYGTL